MRVIHNEGVEHYTVVGSRGSWMILAEPKGSDDDLYMWFGSKPDAEAVADHLNLNLLLTRKEV